MRLLCLRGLQECIVITTTKHNKQELNQSHVNTKGEQK